MSDRYAFLLSHDAFDSWPAPARLFDRAWDARAALGRVLTVRPDARGIVARYDAAVSEWVCVPSFHRETARQWWERAAGADVPIGVPVKKNRPDEEPDDAALFDLGEVIA